MKEFIIRVLKSDITEYERPEGYQNPFIKEQEDNLAKHGPTRGSNYLASKLSFIKALKKQDQLYRDYVENCKKAIDYLELL